MTYWSFQVRYGSKPHKNINHRDQNHTKYSKLDHWCTVKNIQPIPPLSFNTMIHLLTFLFTTTISLLSSSFTTTIHMLPCLLSTIPLRTHTIILSLSSCHYLHSSPPFAADHLHLPHHHVSFLNLITIRHHHSPEKSNQNVEKSTDLKKMVDVEPQIHLPREAVLNHKIVLCVEMWIDVDFVIEWPMLQKVAWREQVRLMVATQSEQKRVEGQGSTSPTTFSQINFYFFRTRWG